MSEKAAAAPVLKKAKDKNKVCFDRMLLLVALALMGISVVLISSASVMESLTRFNDPMYFLKRQLVYHYNILPIRFLFPDYFSPILPSKSIWG